MIVDQAVYHRGRRTDAVVAEGAGPPAEGFAWFELREPTAEEIDRVGRGCGLHDLVIEDVRKAHQRAKWDAFDGADLFVLKSASYEPPDTVRIGEIQVVVGDRFVITVAHGPTLDLGKVRGRLERDPQLLARGPMAVLYAAADLVVDGYAPLLAELETDIDEAEEAVFDVRVRANQAPRVYRLKRQVLELNRNVVPVADLLAELCETDAGIVPASLKPYFGDVSDHAQRVVGRVEVARELLTDALNANLAQQSVQQNEDMRKISAWAAVIATPTLLAGIWGMNFRHMPELDWWVGYPMALALMVAVASSLIAYFRHSGWL